MRSPVCKSDWLTSLSGVERGVRKDFTSYLGRLFFSSANRCRRYDDFDKPGRHVIEETGDQPVARQCRNGAQGRDVDRNSRARIGHRFALKFALWYLKI